MSVKHKSFMEERVVSPSKKYDGDYDSQKLNDWITETKIYYEGKGYQREQWSPSTAIFLTRTAFHWYILWRNTNSMTSVVSTWEDMIAQMRRNLMSQDPEWASWMRMVMVEYHSDIQKHIDHYLRIVDPIKDATNIEKTFFIRSLSVLLQTKLAQKRKKFTTLNEAFDKAIHYVVNRPDIGKRDPKENENKWLAQFRKARRW